MKLLTISVAGYNVEKFIRQTLDSLICKHIDQLEVLVVDDGGKDNTLAIAQEYAERYPGCIIPVHKENGGWGSTVNYSIRHATGKYFKLLDGDDYFDTENLDAVLEFMQTADADVVYTPYRTFDDETGHKVEDFDLSGTIATNKILNIRDLTLKNGLEMHALAFRTTILQQNNVTITEKCFYTDNEYRTKGLAFSRTIVFSDLCLYQYRVGREGQSVDITGMRKHYRDSITMAKALIDFHASRKEQASPYVCECIINGINFAYKILIILNKKQELKKYDQNVKENSPLYNEAHEMNLGILRSLDFNGLTFFSALLRFRYKYAPKVKRLLHLS